MKFSLMFFSSAEGPAAWRSYETIVETARFADREGFERIWLPERHFVAFGALHPNPSVLAAAVARETSRVRIAAGSVVAPLHDPIRIAEEWSVVDHLSRGRVDVAFASGWRAEDFALAPDAYRNRKVILAHRVSEVRALWRGEPLTRRSGGDTETPITTFPRPFQRELPVWITAARSVETFELAGSLGANVLTYLVDVGLDGLSERITAYRAARERAGFLRGGGCVTVMLHTYLGTDSAAVRALAEPAYHRYLVANRSLFASRRADAHSRLSLVEAEQLASAQFERLFEGLSLVGSVDKCAATVEALRGIGTDEIACLVDFVDDLDAAVAALPAILDLRRLSSTAPAAIVRAAEHEREVGGDLLATASVRVDDAAFYRYIESIGGHYGPTFRLVREVVADESNAIAALRAPSADVRAHSRALLADAALSTAHAIGMTPGLRASSRRLGLPIGIGRVEAFDLTSDSYVVRTTRRGGDRGWIDFDVDVRTEDGRRALSLDAVKFQRVSVPLLESHHESSARSLIHDVLWRPLAVDAPDDPDAPPAFAVTAADQADERAIVGALRHAGCAAYGTEDASAASNRSGLRDPIPILFAHAMPRWTCGDVERPRAVVACIGATAKRWSGTTGRSPLIVLVRGANRVDDGDPAPDPVAAAGWAAACSLDLNVVDLDPRRRLEEMIPHVVALATRRCVTPVALRGDTLYEQSFVSAHAERAEDATDAPPVRPGSSVLVTGGTGALGRWLAGWLSEEGVGRIRLVARHASRGSALADRLRPRTAIELVDADIADADGANRAAGSFETVFHLAGDVVSARGARVDEETIDRCFRPKLDGLLNLHRSLPIGLQTLVLFSSISALTGSAGQAAYAAANAAMAAAAQHLADRDRIDLRILWFGPWGGGGMSEGADVQALLQAKGVAAMAPWKALTALRLVLASTRRMAVVVALPAPDVADDTSRTHSDHSTVDVERTVPAALAALRALSPADGAARLEAEIIRQVAEILELAPSQIDPTRSVYDIGFDSLMALELKNVVLRDYGVAISLTDVMQFNTVREIAHALVPVLLGTPRDAEAKPPTAATRPEPAATPAEHELIL